MFLTGADKQETTVKIFGQVAVSAYGNCELGLKVNSLAISGPDGKVDITTPYLSYFFLSRVSFLKASNT